MADKPEIMTADEVAEHIRIPVRMVYQHVRSGTLPAFHVGRTVRFRRQAIDAWMDRSGTRHEPVGVGS